VPEYTIVLSFSQRGLGAYRLRRVSSRQPGKGVVALSVVRSTESRHAPKASVNETSNAWLAAWFRRKGMSCALCASTKRPIVVSPRVRESYSRNSAP